MAGAEVGWDEVTYLKKRPQRAAEARSQKAVSAAQRKGEAIDTTKKCTYSILASYV